MFCPLGGIKRKAGWWKRNFFQILVAMKKAGGIIRAPFLQGFWKRN
jgi:hypothetical protein